jgi:hypothetical protein
MYTHALMTYEQSKKYRELCARGGYTPLELQMGGCIFMPEDDLERYFDGHRRAGYNSFSMTLSGYRELHDLWAGRKGEFDFLMLAAKIGAKLGYKRRENVMLSYSSLPQLQQLTDYLDTLPGEKSRGIGPVGYFGWARMLEKERITRADLPKIPPHLMQYWPRMLHKSEREWFEWIHAKYKSDMPRNKHVAVIMNVQNIGSLETAPCEDIYQKYYEQYMQVYRQIPEVTTLSEKYGDPTNAKIYTLYEMESKWLQPYLTENKLPEMTLPLNPFALTPQD